MVYFVPIRNETNWPLTIMADWVSSDKIGRDLPVVRTKMDSVGSRLVRYVQIRANQKKPISLNFFHKITF